MAVVREIFDSLVCRKIHGCGCCRQSRRPEKYVLTLLSVLSNDNYLCILSVLYNDTYVHNE